MAGWLDGSTVGGHPCVHAFLHSSLPHYMIMRAQLRRAVQTQCLLSARHAILARTARYCLGPIWRRSSAHPSPRPRAPRWDGLSSTLPRRLLPLSPLPLQRRYPCGMRGDLLRSVSILRNCPPPSYLHRRPRCNGTGRQLLECGREAPLWISPAPGDNCAKVSRRAVSAQSGAPPLCADTRLTRSHATGACILLRSGRMAGTPEGRGGV